MVSSFHDHFWPLEKVRSRDEFSPKVWTPRHERDRSGRLQPVQIRSGRGRWLRLSAAGPRVGGAGQGSDGSERAAEVTGPA